MADKKDQGSHDLPVKEIVQPRQEDNDLSLVEEVDIYVESKLKKVTIMALKIGSAPLAGYVLACVLPAVGFAQQPLTPYTTMPHEPVVQEVVEEEPSTLKDKAIATALGVGTWVVEKGAIAIDNGKEAAKGILDEDEKIKRLKLQLREQVYRNDMLTRQLAQKLNGDLQHQQQALTCLDMVKTFVVAVDVEGNGHVK